jgi:hypothetical protein
VPFAPARAEDQNNGQKDGAVGEHKNGYTHFEPLKRNFKFAFFHFDCQFHWA